MVWSVFLPLSAVPVVLSSAAAGAGSTAPVVAAHVVRQPSPRAHVGGALGARGPRPAAPAPTSAPERGLTPAAPSDGPTRPPTKPARVSFVAYPGGRIYVDGKLAGTDQTSIMTLAPGKHAVRVENRFLAGQTITVDLPEARVGVVIVEW